MDLMDDAADWSFVRRPKWILSHLFAAMLIIGFVSAGFWQLDRLDTRRDTNERVESRSLQSAAPLASVLEPADDEADLADSLDYVAVSATGRFVDAELARVANRSQDGRGGDWVVAVFETDDGRLLIVNRGFVLRSEVTADAPAGEVEIEGFLRRSREQGWIGGTDNPDAERMPRLNVGDVIVRMQGAGFDTALPVVPLWLQLDTIDGAEPSAASGETTDAATEAGAGVDAIVTPRPIPLGSLDEGNHLSYAVQWFSMAALSIVVYGLMLRRVARRPDS